MNASHYYSVLKQRERYNANMISSYCNWKVALSVSVVLFITGILIFAFKDFNSNKVEDDVQSAVGQDSNSNLSDADGTIEEFNNGNKQSTFYPSDENNDILGIPNNVSDVDHTQNYTNVGESGTSNNITENNEIMFNVSSVTTKSDIEYSSNNTSTSDLPDINKNDDVSSNFNKTEAYFNETNSLNAISNSTFGNNTMDIVNNSSNFTNTSNLNFEIHHVSLNDTSYINNTIQSTNEGISLMNDTLSVIKMHLNCTKSNYETQKSERGNYFVFENMVKAGHGELECYQHVTLATHGEFVDLNNLETIAARWSGPISIALFSPGTDFMSVVLSIEYLRLCSPVKELIKQWVTFHVYLPLNHVMKNLTDVKIDCSSDPPYSISIDKTYRNENKVIYPANIGRNIARDLALTHYIMSLDIDKFPSPNLGNEFLNMIANNTSLINPANNTVFAVQEFEINEKQQLPENKTQLLDMLNGNVSFLSSGFNSTPYINEWMTQQNTSNINVLGVVKRLGQYSKWITPYMSSKKDPMFEEQIMLDSTRGLMAQSYILCTADYDFAVLSNAFVIHYTYEKQDNVTNVEVINNTISNNNKDGLNQTFTDTVQSNEGVMFQNISQAINSSTSQSKEDNESVIDWWKTGHASNKTMNENGVDIANNSSSINGNITISQNKTLNNNINETISQHELNPGREDMRRKRDVVNNDLRMVTEKILQSLHHVNLTYTTHNTSRRRDIRNMYYHNLLRQKYDNEYGSRDGCYLF